MMRWLMALVVFLPFLTAATLHGSVYDPSLTPLNDAIIEIDTTPFQTFVAKDGRYQFVLNPGTYTITASYSRGTNEYRDSENITIQSEGDYIIDLILVPVYDPHELSEDIPNPSPFEERSSSFLNFVIILTFLAIIILLVTKLRKNKAKKVDLDDEVEKIFDFIKKNKRTTQKEIRKEFFVSEAKISLIISELESKGKIQKIKKGRGNLILLK